MMTEALVGTIAGVSAIVGAGMVLVSRFVPFLKGGRDKHESRISVLESEMKGVYKKLDRMDGKLDRLCEKL